MSESAPDIPPDTKDWTWTLERTCQECGFTAGEVAGADVPALIRSLTAPWAEVLQRPDVAIRHRPDRWAALEYACHVRDVCRVFTVRLRLMLERETPAFPDFAPDDAAAAGRYAEQAAPRVGAELTAAAGGLAADYAAVQADGSQWERTGLRSDGKEFTVLALGRYLLHDLAHHLHDVGARPSAAG